MRPEVGELVEVERPNGERHTITVRDVVDYRDGSVTAGGFDEKGTYRVKYIEPPDSCKCNKT